MTTATVCPPGPNGKPAHRFRLAEANGTRYVDSVCRHCSEHRMQRVTHQEDIGGGQWGKNHRESTETGRKVQHVMRPLTPKIKRCVDCQTAISKTSTRCVSCATRLRRKERFCVDCDAPLVSRGKNAAKRCKPCAAKARQANLRKAREAWQARKAS